MVHTDESVTYDEALTEPFGLLVISVLFRFGRENPELKRVTDHFREIADPQKSILALSLCIDDIILSYSFFLFVFTLKKMYNLVYRNSHTC